MKPGESECQSLRLQSPNMAVVPLVYKGGWTTTKAWSWSKEQYSLGVLEIWTMWVMWSQTWVERVIDLK